MEDKSSVDEIEKVMTEIVRKKVEGRINSKIQCQGIVSRMFWLPLMLPALLQIGFNYVWNDEAF